MAAPARRHVRPPSGRETPASCLAHACVDGVPETIGNRLHALVARMPRDTRVFEFPLGAREIPFVLVQLLQVDEHVAGFLAGPAISSLRTGSFQNVLAHEDNVGRRCGASVVSSRTKADR